MHTKPTLSVAAIVYFQYMLQSTIYLIYILILLSISYDDSNNNQNILTNGYSGHIGIKTSTFTSTQPPSTNPTNNQHFQQIIQH